MLLIVHQCFLVILSHKIIFFKQTLQTTNKFFFFNIIFLWVFEVRLLETLSNIWELEVFLSNFALQVAKVEATAAVT
jgi:hypothetical protein